MLGSEHFWVPRVFGYILHAAHTSERLTLTSDGGEISKEFQNDRFNPSQKDVPGGKPGGRQPAGDSLPIPHT